MRLVELEVSGFKSFAGTTLFRFTPGLTAIIGPNGSGKSNLAEAVRWVLGEQSLKQLRSVESEDIIFAGSAQKPRSTSARVVLTLANESGRLGVDAPEVTIARLVSRTGESHYLLNGDPVRLFDIQHLLAEAGIGSKSYTVISQGMVDRYLTATPAQRRELFDEACGIKALQLKLNRAISQLSQSQQQIAEVRRLLDELAPRLRVLKRQIQRHEERTALAARYGEQQAGWYRAEWQRRHKHLEAAHAALAQARAATQAARLKREQIEQKLLAAAQQPASPGAALHAELQEAEREFQIAQAAFQKHHSERQLLEESLAQSQWALTVAEEKLAQARQHTQPGHLFGTLRALLSRCRELVAAIRGQTGLDPEAVAALDADLAAMLENVSSDTSVIDIAQRAVRDLEGPLQATARLQALVQDREQRLAALAEPVQPDPQRLHELRQAVKRLPAGQTAEPQADLSQALTQARETELACERAGEAAAIAEQQAEAALHELMREAQRERGTDFMQALPSETPSAEALAVTLVDLERVRARLAALGEIDPLAMKEYNEASTRSQELETQLQDIEETYTTTEHLIQDLKRTIHDRFRQQFKYIQEHFSHYFTQLFGGGQAQLSIIDTAGDEENESHVQGVEITAHPPDKKPQRIQALSGGERALAALALIMAVVKTQQPPFIVFDEVDAALDEANSFRFAELLQQLSQTTQCVVITHNRETMGLADVLYGITMNADGISHSYSVKLSDIPETEITEEVAA
jgi:chromosome segregation ATPase